jgi:hypothetical protein
MKTMKSLVLGSAAALVAIGGAQAADLPVKAKAVEYVKVCSLYGAGFYYIPGTDTCIKLGGYLRVDVLANTNADDTGNVTPQGSLKNRLTNGYTWRSREDFNIETRTQTEYGVLRTYADFTFSWTSDSFTSNSAGSTTYASFAGASVPGNAGSGNVAFGQVGVYFAFIQFAGFTIGKAISQFSMPWVNYPANNFDGLVGGGGTVTGVNQFTYTWGLGGGNTFTLSAQDSAAYYVAGNNNLGGPGNGVTGGTNTGFGSGDTAGFISPDFIAMFRSDNSAYAFQISTALHDNHAAYYSTPVGGFGSGSELSGHPDDLWGWAVAGGFTIKNLPTGAGDTLNAQAVYTHGATRYNIQDLGAAYGAPLIFGNTSNPAAYPSFAFNSAPDTVFVNGGSQHAITTYGGQAGFNHNWSPFWSSGLYGAAAAVRYDDASKLAICGPNGNFTGTLLNSSTAFVLGTNGVAGAGVCNPNYEIYQAGFITRWTPVKGLTFSGDVTWSHIEQHNQGLATFSSGTGAKPAALYEFKNQDNVLLPLRAQRNW